MKLTSWLIAVLLTGFLCLSGAACKKKVVVDPPKTPQEAAIQLRMSLGTASPQVKSIYYDQIDNAVHYEKYREALTGLGALTNEPSLTEEQKKLANQLAEMMQAKLNP